MSGITGNGEHPLMGCRYRRIQTFLTEYPGYVNSAALSPDVRTLATGTFDGTIRLWDVATGKEEKND